MTRTTRSAACVRGGLWSRTACLCGCHFGDAASCACPDAASAVVSAVHSSPQSSVLASSQRTAARHSARSFAIRTPLGTTSRFSSPLS